VHRIFQIKQITDKFVLEYLSVVIVTKEGRKFLYIRTVVIERQHERAENEAIVAGRKIEGQA